jgi:hypothetical protein
VRQPVRVAERRAAFASSTLAQLNLIFREGDPPPRLPMFCEDFISLHPDGLVTSPLSLRLRTPKLPVKSMMPKRHFK